jgi:hypothetical protein
MSNFKDSFGSPNWAALSISGYRWWLGLSLLAMAACRLFWASRHGWNADEGLFCEISLSWAHGQLPRAGAIFQNGFAPLTAPALAPVLAAPIQWLGLASALTLARLWALALQALTLVALAALASHLAGRRAGLAAAWAFALASGPAWLGSFAFYHHLPALFLSLSCLFWIAWTRQAHAKTLGGMALMAGLCAASAYWLFWVPPLLLALVWMRSGWRALAQSLLLSFGPLALSLLWSWHLDPQGFREDLAWTRGLASALGPGNALILARSLGATLASFPLLAAGLAGFCVALRRHGWSLIFPALAFLISVSQALLQRGDLSLMPYPLIAALPLAIFGMVLGFFSMGRGSSIFFFAALASLACIPNTAWVDALCDPAPQAQELATFLKSATCPGDLIIGQSNFDWDLDPSLKAAEASQVAAWEGLQAAYMRPGLPKTRFVFEPAFTSCRFLVTSQQTMLNGAREPGTRQILLRAASERWPRVWDDGAFRVYSNPRIGGWQAASAALHIP